MQTNQWVGTWIHGWKRNTRIRKVDEDVARIRWLLSSNLNKATKSHRRAEEGVQLLLRLALQVVV
jgi:hypothetical protein